MKNLVRLLFILCVAVAWHSTAQAQCANPGPPYCNAAGFPPANCLVCSNSVCGYDPYCCQTAWDSICANEAAADANCVACKQATIPDCNGVPGGPAIPGSSCDDGDPCTTSDTWNAGCICAGTPLPDGDSDGLCDAYDNCPTVPGQIGSACNDGNAGTVLDLLDGTCTCAGVPYACPDNVVGMILQTDDYGEETAWDIVPAAGGAATCSGTFFTYPSNSVIAVPCCLASGCYNLTVYDSFGDGMCCVYGNGGYRLVTGDNSRIIDNSYDGGFASSSATAATPDFCVPISAVTLKPATCDNLNLNPSSSVSVNPVAAVSAQWMVGNQTDDGYQYWIFDPDGSYSRRLLQNHTKGAGPYGPTRCGTMKLSAMSSLPVPGNKLLNIRVRSMVNGVYSEFGPACTIKNSGCVTVQLLNAPGHPRHSCGISDVPLNGHKTLWATQAEGANKYQFRFVAPGYSRNIAKPTNSLLMTNTWAVNPLQYNTTYAVTVRASYDNGTTYCAFGPSCNVTTSAPQPPAAPTRAVVADDDADSDINRRFVIYPNPNTGDQLSMTLRGVPPRATEVMLEIFDVNGRMVMSRQVGANGHTFEAQIELNNELANGVYSVHLTAGDRKFMQRLVIQ